MSTCEIGGHHRRRLFNAAQGGAAGRLRMIVQTPAQDWGDAAMLANYTQARKRDTRGGILFTDLLINMFGNEIIGLPAARGLGLGALQLISPIKSLLVGKMSFGK